MGVIDLEAKNELIPIQHKNITIENDYFIVYENFGEKNKVVLILKFNKTIILYLKDGYDKINFMEKYIVAEADNNVIVVDYNGKILAKFTS